MPSALNMRLRSSARAGLPLDESSATSLKASRAQYQTAVKELTEYPFDALFFSGFTSAYDAQCALMGARAVYDGPVFLSYALTDAWGAAPRTLIRLLRPLRSPMNMEQM